MKLLGVAADAAAAAQQHCRLSSVEHGPSVCLSVDREAKVWTTRRAAERRRRRRRRSYSARVSRIKNSASRRPRSVRPDTRTMDSFCDHCTRMCAPAARSRTPVCVRVCVCVCVCAPDVCFRKFARNRQNCELVAIAGSRSAFHGIICGGVWRGEGRESRL